MSKRIVTLVSLLVILSLLFLSAFAISASAKSKVMSPPPGMINSVVGPISPNKLGTTLIHEHFSFAYPGWFADETIAPYNYKAVLKRNLAVIKAAKKY